LIITTRRRQFVRVTGSGSINMAVSFGSLAELRRRWGEVNSRRIEIPYHDEQYPALRRGSLRHAVPLAGSKNDPPRSFLKLLEEEFL
jgi:hypothetical protein